MATSKVTVHFPYSVEQVWRTVTDLSHTAWRSDLARVEVLDETHFVEHTKSGHATEFTVTACEPLRFWAFTMENGNTSCCKCTIPPPAYWFSSGTSPESVEPASR